jgi:hypothetical protein
VVAVERMVGKSHRPHLLHHPENWEYQEGPGPTLASWQLLEKDQILWCSPPYHLQEMVMGSGAVPSLTKGQAVDIPSYLNDTEDGIGRLPCL